MSWLTKSPLPTLQVLSASLGSLGTVLEPLLGEHSLEAITESLQNAKEEGAEERGGRLDSARLQVSMAYVLLDLVWIYLKTKGIDPSQHPVMVELERVKGYFAKIKQVQEKDEQEAHAKLDKSAAGRFIRAALASNRSQDSAPPSPAPSGKHTKFNEEKQNTTSENEVPEPQAKKGRTLKDPFEGYDNATNTPKRQAESTPSTPQSKKRKAKK